MINSSKNSSEHSHIKSKLNLSAGCLNTCDVCVILQQSMQDRSISQGQSSTVLITHRIIIIYDYQLKFFATGCILPWVKFRN